MLGIYYNILHAYPMLGGHLRGFTFCTAYPMLGRHLNSGTNYYNTGHNRSIVLHSLHYAPQAPPWTYYTPSASSLSLPYRVWAGVCGLACVGWRVWAGVRAGKRVLRVGWREGGQACVRVSLLIE